MTQPEDAAEKKHHLAQGKGFTNPWDSYVEMGVWELAVKGFFWWVVRVPFLSFSLSLSLSLSLSP